MNKTIFATACVTLVALCGCSAADYNHLTNYGQPGRVTCYSGGRVISDDYSTGRIESEPQSDGWYYVSSTRNTLMHVSGQCVVEQRQGGAPANFRSVYPS